MTRIILMLLVFTISTNSLAQEVKYVEKGELAPYSGYLFSEAKERVARLSVEELKYCNKTKELTENLNKVYEEKTVNLNARLDLKDKQIENLSDQLTKKDTMFTKIGFFLLGAVLTGGIAYGMSRAIR